MPPVTTILEKIRWVQTGMVYRAKGYLIDWHLRFEITAGDEDVARAQTAGNDCPAWLSRIRYGPAHGQIRKGRQSVLGKFLNLHTRVRFPVALPDTLCYLASFLTLPKTPVFTRKVSYRSEASGRGHSFERAAPFPKPLGGAGSGPPDTSSGLSPTAPKRDAEIAAGVLLCWSIPATV